MTQGRYQIFVYGTLLVPEVMQRVTGRQPPGRPATLKGYQRYRLHQRSYPGIVPEPAAEVAGLLYSVDSRILTTLDRYEDPYYERCPVIVETASGKHEAYAYVIPPARRHLIDPRPWDLEFWRQQQRRQ